MGCSSSSPLLGEGQPRARGAVSGEGGECRGGARACEEPPRPPADPRTLGERKKQSRSEPPGGREGAPSSHGPAGSRKSKKKEQKEKKDLWEVK